MIFPIIKNTKNRPKSTITIQAPVGTEYKYEINTPATKQKIDKITDKITVVKNLLQIRIAVSDGKAIRLDIRSVPIILIPRVTVIAVKIAIIML